MSQSLIFAVTLTSGPLLTVANATEIANAFRAAFPAGRMVWGFSDVAITDAEYQDLRDYVAAQVIEHGDGAAYYMGFPGNSVTVADAKTLMDIYIPRVAERTGAPVTSLLSWHLPAPLVKYALDEFGIRTVIGQVWSQEGIDGFSGEGSVNCPYYPSVNNALIPAQTEANRIDSVLLDCISGGLWDEQTPGHDGRITVHPVDGRTLARIQHITTEYLEFPDPLKYVANMVEMDWINDTTSTNTLVYSGGVLVAKARLLDWLGWLPSAFPDLAAVRVDEFGDAWRAQHPTNDFSVAQTGANPDDATERIYWLFTAKQRVAVVLDGSTLRSADWTPYDEETAEPTAPTANWSLPQRVAQHAAAHVSNPNLVMPYRALSGVFRAHADLLEYLR